MPPADPSRVGLPKWKDPNMAARAAIHLCGKYEVGDLLGEGAVQKATSHRAAAFCSVSKDQKISNVFKCPYQIPGKVAELKVVR